MTTCYIDVAKYVQSFHVDDNVDQNKCKKKEGREGEREREEEKEKRERADL